MKTGIERRVWTTAVATNAVKMLVLIAAVAIRTSIPLLVRRDRY